MWFPKIIFFTLLLVTQFSFAADLAGHYYAPAELIYGNVEFIPETLLTINSDGTYEVNTVHDGFRATYIGTYVLSGTKLTLTNGNYTTKCDWSRKIDTGKLIGDYNRTITGLLILPEDRDEPVYIDAATPEEVIKVESAISCGR